MFHKCGDYINYMGKRHATRLMNEAYGRGIVRGQVENLNLRAYHDTKRVTAAEAIMTCRTTKFLGVDSVNMIQRLVGNEVPDSNMVLAEVDMRCRKFRNVTLRNVAALYGQRPK